MAQLVDYRCSRCSTRAEHWVVRPFPPEQSCDRCGGAASRLFGFSRMSSKAPLSTIGPGHVPAHDLPGACTLTDTAARMLSARARSDNRAIEREIRYQESAIAAGRLDPTASSVTTFPGGPPAAARPPLGGGPVA